MVRSLLSALLLGLFPLGQDTSTDASLLGSIPIAPPHAAVEIEHYVSASGILIVDVDSGQSLFERNATSQRPMASLTKLMTALLIVENHDLDERVIIPQNVRDTPGNVAYLPPGSIFSVGDLLSALLISSANDAAITLAQFHSGSVQAFVTAMNQRALELGLHATAFRNPAGLDHPAHWSTSRDIAWLSIYAFRKPEIAERMSRSGQRIYSEAGEAISLYHTHSLLHRENPVVAGKTGTTEDAGQCLVSFVETEKKKYVVVLLQSSQRYEDMNTILAALEDHEQGKQLADRHSSQ